MRHKGHDYEITETVGGFGFNVPALNAKVPNRHGETRPYPSHSAATSAAKRLIDRAAPVADGGI